MHLVKFLRKLSKIEGGKNFFEARRGERYQIQTFDNNPPHFNGSITSLSLIVIYNFERKVEFCYSRVGSNFIDWTKLVTTCDRGSE